MHRFRTDIVQGIHAAKQIQSLTGLRAKRVNSLHPSTFSNKRFEFKKTRGLPTVLETRIAWKSALLTKIIFQRTLLV